MADPKEAIDASSEGKRLGVGERIFHLVLSLALFAAPFGCFYIFMAFGPSFWVARVVVAVIVLAMTKQFWGLAFVAFRNFITGTKGRKKGTA